MAYTYDPIASNRDRVRFRIGDTDDTEWLLRDEEIDDLLTSYSLAVATAKACRAAAAVLARKVNQSISGSVGSGSTSQGSRYHNMIQLAEVLEAEAGGIGVLVPAVVGFTGGISEAEKDTADADTDRITPIFTRDLFRHPEDT